jgi:hypothetical protein
MLRKEVKHTDRMKLRICIQFYSNFMIQSGTGRHLFCVPHTLWNIYRKWPHKYSMLSLLVSTIHDWNFQRTETQDILIKFPMTQSANSSHTALILHKNKSTNFYHHIPDIVQHKFYIAIMLDTGHHPRYIYYIHYFERSLFTHFFI